MFPMYILNTRYADRFFLLVYAILTFSQHKNATGFIQLMLKKRLPKKSVMICCEKLQNIKQIKDRGGFKVSNLIVQEKPVLKPSEEELKAYAVIAKKSFKEKLSLTQNPEEMPVEGTVVFAAQFAITSAFIHSWIYTNTPLHFPDMDVKFSADVWGVGLGGGVVWLSGWISASNGADILGDVDFALNTCPAHTELVFTQGGKTIGVLAGVGLNAQVGVFSGKGSFTKW